MPRGLTRRFWMTVRTPADARPGLYKGTMTIRAAKGETARIPLEFRVRSGKLDPVDIPAGPFGYTIGIPWFGDDPKAAPFNQQMVKKSLQKMRDYGFTACSGLPSIAYRGFDQGKPMLDFTRGRRAMKLLKELGFLASEPAMAAAFRGLMPIPGLGCDELGGVHGLRGFRQGDLFADPASTRSQRDWIPVYYNLADEPIGDDLVRSAENAEAYRRAFPKGRLYFTGASSFTGSNRDDPSFPPGEGASMSSSWNDHDEAAVNCSTGRSGLGLLQRRQPLDLRRLTCTRRRNSSA